MTARSAGRRLTRSARVPWGARACAARAFKWEGGEGGAALCRRQGRGPSGDVIEEITKKRGVDEGSRGFRLFAACGAAGWAGGRRHSDEEKPSVCGWVGYTPVVGGFCGALALLLFGVVCLVYIGV